MDNKLKEKRCQYVISGYSEQWNEGWLFPSWLNFCIFSQLSTMTMLCFFLIFTYFIKSLQSVIIIKYTTIYKDYIHFAQTFTSQYIVSLRNIVYIYHQTIKSNNSSVTAPVSTDIFFINYIIRKYTAVNWAFKNVFYKIWTYNISFTECFFSMFWLKPCA